MTVKLESDEPLSDTHTLLLCINDKPVAALHNAFTDADNALEMKSETLTHHAPLFGAMHSASIILNTVMQSWEEDHMCIEDVFANGVLVVDPALYNS